MNAEPKTCFLDSRRLTGPNVWFARDAHPPCGAVLETDGPLARDPLTHARWHAAVRKMSAALGWPEIAPVIRPHAGGAILALRAPQDQLLLATEVNEWAWELAVGLIAPAPEARNPDYAEYTPIHPLGGTYLAALSLFRERAGFEHNPTLMALLNEAQARSLPALLDDEYLSIGSGTGSISWLLGALPAVADVDWDALHGVPTLLVTGTNGKTTSVRLLAAVAQRAGLASGYCCTDGVFVDGVMLDAGDYSGPAGARAVLRSTQVQFAVLESARGGILRRGLAVDSARAALVTNVTPEHFGEYGIDTVEQLADTKLVVAQTLGSEGTLTLNADDPLLLARAAGLRCKLALFAFDYAHSALQAQRERGALCCGVRDGQLMLFDGAAEHALGAIADMPLTVGGGARYNIANCAGAALTAAAAGFTPALIAQVLASFGADRHDNPGRLERWDLPDVTVLLDYAHNPEGLDGLLTVARALRDQRATATTTTAASEASVASGTSAASATSYPSVASAPAATSAASAPASGRIGLLLGQAGNRGDEAIGELADTAAAFRPERIVLKDIGGFMRGREAGEVPGLLRARLIRAGMDAADIVTVLPEVDAACALLRWAQAGDVLVLPVHNLGAKRALQQVLDALQAKRWQAGQPLPPSGDAMATAN